VKVHVVGDSHAAKFEWWKLHGFPSTPEYVIYGLGGITAHAFAQPPESASVTREARRVFADIMQGVADDDLVLMVLGDGDCRVHLYDHHMRDGIPLETLIADTMARYGAFLATVGKRMAVLDVPPAQEIGNIYNFTHYGTREQRAAIAVMFNAELKRMCEANGILFVGIHDRIADANGFLSVEYAHPDGAHVLDSAVQFVDEIINEYAASL